MAAMLKPADVAAEFNCSAEKVRRLCKAGKLRAMRLGSDWRISAADLAVYVAANTTSPAVQAVQPARSVATSPAALTLLPAADMDGALPYGWWETTTTSPASSAGRRGGSATKKKAASVRS